MQTLTRTQQWSGSLSAMAQPRVVITKLIGFRGGTEEFTNGYTLTGDHADYTDATWITLIDALVAIERSIHGQQIDFVRAQAGGAGEPVDHTRVLSGSGSRGATGATLRVHPELCQLAEAVVSSTRTLRKYYHVGRLTQTPDGDTLQAADKATTELVKLSNGTLPNGAKVCAPNGDVPVVAWDWDPYVRVHQFRAGSRRPPAA